MADEFKDVTTQGWGSRIVDSLKGLIIGPIIFIASFVVLYWNEGRVDLSKLAQTSIEISSEQKNTNPALNGKLVNTTGNIVTTEILGDGLFLTPGKYLAYHRNVEMFGWAEHKSERKEKNIGGSETTETTYTYEKKWLDEHDVKTSDNFKHKQDHENPAMTLKSERGKVKTASIGVYKIDMANLDSSIEQQKLSLTKENITLSPDAKIEGEFIFVSKNKTSSLNNPQVGDLKISYSILPVDTRCTIFGTLNDDRITEYFDDNNNKLYRIFSGNKQAAIAQLHSEFSMISWLIRLVGFVMMWGGLAMFFQPLSVLLDVLPFLGSLGSVMIGFITFLVSLPLAIVTIIISMIAHNLIALLIALALTLGIIFYFFKRRKNRNQ